MKTKEIKAISVSRLKENDIPMNILNDDIILAGNVEYNLDMLDHPCRLDTFVIMLCIKGEAEIHVNLRQHTIKAGMLALSVPENIIQINRTENFVVYPIFISEAFLRKIKIELNEVLSLYMYVKGNPVMLLSIEDIRSLEKFYFLIEDIMQSTDARKVYIMKGLIYALLFKLDEIAGCHLQSDKSVTNHKSRSETIFDLFMQLLAQFHNQERSVKFYAGKMNITSNYLSGLIKEYSGKTAAEWIDEYVILEAKTLLKHSGLSIQEVAYQLNFSTQTFFGKYFKRITGMSPKKFMRQ